MTSSKFIIETLKMSKYVSVAVIFTVTMCVIMSRNGRGDPLVAPHLDKYLRGGARAHGNDSERRGLRNTHAFGPVERDTVVLAVLVHGDVERLRWLVVSLASVRHVSDALLVFSHLRYDAAADALARLVDFCRVLQIHYPPDAPDDRKLHWWWTSRFLFEEAPWARVRREMVMFVDEASHVLPDLLHVFRSAKRALAFAPDARLLSLGRSPAAGLAHDRLLVDAWRPPLAGGVAFDGSVWRDIRAAGAAFCADGDARWSHSLGRLFSAWGGGRALCVAAEAPRVLSSAPFDGGRAAAAFVRRTVAEAALFPGRMRAVSLFARGARVTREMHPSLEVAGAWPHTSLCLRALAAQPLTDA